MAEWSPRDREWLNQFDPYQYGPYEPYYQEKETPPVSQCKAPQAQPFMSPPSPTLMLLLSSPLDDLSPPMQYPNYAVVPRGDNPREIRNKAEKQRRDKLNQSITDLASMVPPVVGASRKMHKTGVLRLTAHYLRAHQYVFGDSISQSAQEFTPSSAQALLALLNGFLLTTTYRGIVVVVSQNVSQFLGYSELDLLGQSIFSIIHEDDRHMFQEHLMPKSQMLGPNGELLMPEDPDDRRKAELALAQERRRFIVRFKKLSQRAQSSQYVTCHVEGSLRKSDRACRGYNRCCQMVRRARARGDNPCTSGNDIVFIGVVRPTSETFINESGLESFRMEYRTRHSIDGEIIQSEQRIALVTGYMMHEVNGVNAMNFMHRDDVRWVIIALREMYDQHRLFGESCYRLMTKNGQFIYMRTRGRLDVNQDSRAVTSFVCTNTVVGEEEGKHLIKLMKKKFTMMVNNNEDLPEEEDFKDVSDNETVPVEDPRQLEKVILHLVTNLPSPQSEDNPRSVSPDNHDSPLRLSIIPPKKERIVSAIEKIYNVIKTFQRQANHTPDVVKRQANEDTTNRVERSPIYEPKNYMEQSIMNQTIALNNSHLTDNVLSAPQKSNYTYNDYELTQLQEGQSNVQASRDSGNQYFTDNNGVLTETCPQVMPTDFDTEHVNDNVVLNNKKATKIKYEIYSAKRSNVENINFQGEVNMMQEAGMSSSISGTKRPNYFDDEDITSKKKIFDDVKGNEQTPGHDSPALENFFDEAMLNTQIESAIISLEHTIDPSFPDLLISKEVQDILGEIEEE